MTQIGQGTGEVSTDTGAMDHVATWIVTVLANLGLERSSGRTYSKPSFLRDAVTRLRGQARPI